MSIKSQQIPYTILETISHFFTTQLLCIFLAQTLHTFYKSTKCKLSYFPLLALKFTKFLMSFLERRVNFFSNFASLFSVMRHSSSLLFHLNQFGKMPVKILQNSSCYFWKRRSVVLQVLHQFWVPSNMTPQYFFSSSIIYFRQKQPIRALRSKFVKFLMSVLNWQVNSSSNFASFFIIMTHNSSVNFKLIHFLHWIKGSNQSPNCETFECSGDVIFQTTSHFSIKFCVFNVIKHHFSVHSKLKYYVLWWKAVH